MIATQTRDCGVYLIKSHEGEKLLEDLYRNFVGFLIKDSSMKIKIDENIVEAEIIRLCSKMLIGCRGGLRRWVLRHG